MQIKLTRPEDPELAKLWDEARETIAQRSAPAATRREVFEAVQLDLDCCVGDRSRCRCAPERGGWSDEDEPGDDQ